MTSARLFLATFLLVATATPSLCLYPNVLGGALHGGGSLQGVSPRAGFLPALQSYPQSPAVLPAAPQSHNSPFQVIFEWNALDYNLPRYPSSLIEAYDPVGSIFTGLEFTPDKYFIVVPRLYPGVPSTLNYIPRNAAGFVSNPKLEPFPSAEWQSATGMDGRLTTGKDDKNIRMYGTVRSRYSGR